MLRDAFRSVGVATGDPDSPAKELQTALEITDALLARIPEIHSERKRFASEQGVPDMRAVWIVLHYGPKARV